MTVAPLSKGSFYQCAVVDPYDSRGLTFQEVGDALKNREVETDAFRLSDVQISESGEVTWREGLRFTRGALATLAIFTGVPFAFIASESARGEAQANRLSSILNERMADLTDYTVVVHGNVIDTVLAPKHKRIANSVAVAALAEAVASSGVSYEVSRVRVEDTRMQIDITDTDISRTEVQSALLSAGCPMKFGFTLFSSEDGSWATETAVFIECLSDSSGAILRDPGVTSERISGAKKLGAFLTRMLDNAANQASGIFADVVRMRSCPLRKKDAIVNLNEMLRRHTDEANASGIIASLGETAKSHAMKDTFDDSVFRIDGRVVSAFAAWAAIAKRGNMVDALDSRRDIEEAAGMFLRRWHRFCDTL